MKALDFSDKDFQTQISIIPVDQAIEVKYVLPG